MWYQTKVTARTSEPLTLAEAKKHCLVLHNDDDDVIDALIKSARDFIETYCGTPLATQTVEMKCDAFADFFRLPVAPVQSVTSVNYVDSDGEDQTLLASVYEGRFDGLDAAIVLKPGQLWPATVRGSRITVTAEAGYVDVPASIRHALRLWVAEAYERREAAPDAGWSTINTLLCNYKRG
jgi:uncharacterized phiE125 gp8 family phage protein